MHKLSAATLEAAYGDLGLKEDGLFSI